MRGFKRSVHSVKLNYGSMSKNCFTPLLRAPEPKADTVIVLVRLGRSMRLNRGERKRRRRSRRRSGDVSVCWGRGAAPPIIKLACCAGGPCLQGRRGSFLHSVDSSERGDGSSEHSLLSGYFCKSSLAALRLANCTHRLIQDESEGGSSN